MNSVKGSRFRLLYISSVPGAPFTNKDWLNHIEIWTWISYHIHRKGAIFLALNSAGVKLIRVYSSMADHGVILIVLSSNTCYSLDLSSCALLAKVLSDGHHFWNPLDDSQRWQTKDESTQVQVMAWCPLAPSHYLSLCWPKSMSLRLVKLRLIPRGFSIFTENYLTITTRNLNTFSTSRRYHLKMTD